MRRAEISFQRANSLDEALMMLAQEGPKSTLLAGGTDLLVWMQAGGFTPERVIDLWGVRGDCGQIREDGDVIAIGALATYSEIIGSDLARQHLPNLVASCREIGAVQIQNRGTIGGNIGGSSPAGDTLPVLLAHDANIVLQSVRGARTVAYSDFCKGYRQIDCADDELITEIRIEKPQAGTVQGWYKAGTRLAQAISKVMVAGCGRLNADGTVADVRIGVGSVAPVPLYLASVRDAVLGNALDDDVLESARQAAIASVTPIDDVRSTAHYRNTVTGNLVVRYLRDLVAG